MHQGKWYYLKEYSKDRQAVVWTRNKEKAITYAHEKSAERAADFIVDHCDSLEISQERI